MSEAHRVVVTGMGAVSPLGRGVDALWSGLLAGRSGLRRLEGLDLTGQEVDFGGQVPNFDPSDILEAKQIKRLDRFAHFAIAASVEALSSAGLPARLSDAQALGTATIIGSGLGGATTLFEQALSFAAKGAGRVSPFLIPGAIGNMAAGEVAIHVNAQGPSFGPVSACATAGHAIGEAYEAIRRGDAERALAGGSEAALHPVVIAGFNNMRALSRSASSAAGGDPTAASRPFDSARDGFVMAEGAGVLLLERLDLALARGATPELDAIRTILTGAPDAATAATADRAALRATVTATKGNIGHTLGAAGALGAAATICAMRDSRVHATLNLTDPDSLVGALDIVRGAPRDGEIRLALVNAFGFGGQNAAILLAKWEGR